MLKTNKMNGVSTKVTTNNHNPIKSNKLIENSVREAQYNNQIEQQNPFITAKSLKNKIERVEKLNNKLILYYT